MNIFRLDDNPVIAAQLNQDVHVKKILLESAQMLANGYSDAQLNTAPLTQKGTVRKHSHPHHPMSKWVVASTGNFEWTKEHAIALCYEFVFRFGGVHFTSAFITWCVKNKPDLVPDGDVTEFPQCFKEHPDCVVANNPVAGYRNYYSKAKRSFTAYGKIYEATWTKRETPEFML